MKTLTRIPRHLATRLSRLDRDNRGQALVIAALALTTLLAMAAILVDVGAGFAERRAEQNAADGAATAGTHLIAIADNTLTTDAKVLAEIDNYAKANGGLLDPQNPPEYLDQYAQSLGTIGTFAAVPVNAAGVLVYTERTVDTHFARVIGQDTMDVGTKSAVLAYRTKMPYQNPGLLLPIGIPQITYAEGQVYDLRQPQYGKAYGVDAMYKGLLNYTAVAGAGFVPGTDWGSQVANVENWCKFGFNGKIALGNVVEMYSGDIGNNVTSSIAAFINAYGLSDEGGKYAFFFLPIWNIYQEKYQPAFQGRVTVSGFAKFKIYEKSDTSSLTYGTFVSYVVPGDIAPDGVNYGPKTLKIINVP